MEELKKLAVYLGFDVHIINDKVFIHDNTGYVLFNPMRKHACLIEEHFQITTIYGAVNGWSAQGEECKHHYASTAAQARYLAALSYLE